MKNEKRGRKKLFQQMGYGSIAEAEDKARA